MGESGWGKLERGAAAEAVGAGSGATELRGAVEIAGGVEDEAGGDEESVDAVGVEAVQHGHLPSAGRWGQFEDHAGVVVAAVDGGAVEIAGGIGDECSLG